MPPAPILTSSLLPSTRCPFRPRPQAGGGDGWSTLLPSLVPPSWLHAGWLARLAGRAAAASLYCLILQTFCFLPCPSPAGPLAEPASLLKNIHLCVAGGGLVCQNGRAVQQRWCSTVRARRVESELDCALRLSLIIRRQKPAKTPKYFFLGLLWVV